MESIANNEIIQTLIYILILSVGANIILLHAFSNKKDKNKKKAPSTENDQIREFVRRQIQETRKHLKQDSEREVNLDNKVTALRVAYLTIEDKALNRTVLSREYWNILNQGLMRLLKIFVPEVLSKNGQIQDLENRVRILSEKLKKLKSSRNAGQCLEFVRDSASRHRGSPAAMAVVDKYMGKMEGAIADFYKPNSDASPSSHEKIKKTISVLEELRGALAQQTKDAVDAEQELSNWSQIDPSTLDEEETLTVTRLRESEALLGEFKDRNIQLENMIESLKAKLVNLEQKMVQSAKAPVMKISNTSDKPQQDTSDIDEISSQVNELTENEMLRLRKIVKEQSDSMRTLNSDLLNLKRQVNESEKLSGFQEEKIVKLQGQMRESEVCVKTLEKEVKDLNHALAQVREKKHSDIYMQSQKDILGLEKQLNTLKDELQESLEKLSLSDSLINYYAESVEADSMEDLAVSIYQSICNMGLSPNLMLSIHGKEIAISGGSELSSREKLMLNNMQLGETQSSFDGAELKFKLRNLKGVLTDVQGVGSDQHYKEALKFLKFSDRLADKIIEKLNVMGQTRALSKCSKDLKTIAYDVDQNMDKNLSAAKGLIRTSFGQLMDLARSSSIDQVKLDQFKRIEANAISELEADSVFRLNVRKRFLKLCKELDG